MNEPNKNERRLKETQKHTQILYTNTSNDSSKMNKE